MISKVKTLIRRGIRNSFLAGETIYHISELPLLPDRIETKLKTLYITFDGSSRHNSAALNELISKQPININSGDISIQKGSIIKAPEIKNGQVMHKGIILIGFEYELERLALHKSLDFVTQHYIVLFMPTWQPFYSSELQKYLKRSTDSIYILPSSQQCYYQGLQSHPELKFLPFHASSWVTEDRIDKSVTEKDIDLLMVANFLLYKRHRLLFEALAELPSNLKVIIAGRALEDRDASSLIEEAKQYGVTADRFDIIESPSDEELVNLVTRSKLTLGLSAREGSYVALAESLIADTPVALFKNAVIGTKNYVNPETGFLLDEEIALAPQIQNCLDLLHLTSPRDWALKNISLEHNFKKLTKYFSHHDFTTPIEEFYLNNFEVLPKTGSWSEAIKESAKQLRNQGINFTNN